MTKIMETINTTRVPMEEPETIVLKKIENGEHAPYTTWHVGESMPYKGYR